jgi:putative ABC transport system permease protein
MMSRRVRSHSLLAAMREAVGIGWAAIRAYKLRAGLTILGIVVGITTVTVMSSIVAGLNATMAAQIERIGSAVIFIRPFTPGQHIPDEEFRRLKGLSLEEVQAIAKRSTIRAVAPMEPLAAAVIKYGNQSVQDAQLFGTTPAFETVHDIYVERGRFITETDVARGAPVAVLGADIAETLFPFLDPVDKEITIDGRRFRVIGVTERIGKFLFFSRDNVLIVPMGVIQKRDPRFNWLIADAKPVSAAVLETAMGQIEETLRRERKLRYRDRNNFGVFPQEALMDVFRQVTGGIFMVMIAISSIGLVVGGVGVMNIMLVSVTERTREIGVRKAIGATRRDIRWQFLTEAMTLTGAGGVLGIAVGGLIAWIVNTVSPFPAVLQPTWVVFAFLTSVAVGLFFGLWPAAKAARLDPIEALRYE